jgi:hypothetical protein
MSKVYSCVVKQLQNHLLPDLVHDNSCNTARSGGVVCGGFMKKHVLVALMLAIQLICSSSLWAQESCKSKPSSFLSSYMTQLSRGAVQGLASSIQCENLTPREKAQVYQRHLTLRYESMINDVNSLFAYFSVTHVGDVTIAEKKLIKEFYDLILGLIPGVSTLWLNYNSTTSLLSELVDGSWKPVNPIHLLEKLRRTIARQFCY